MTPAPRMVTCEDMAEHATPTSTVLHDHSPPAAISDKASQGAGLAKSRCVMSRIQHLKMILRHSSSKHRCTRPSYQPQSYPQSRQPSFMSHIPRSFLGALVFSAALLVAVSAYSENPTPSLRREMLPGEPTTQDLDRARALLETWENESPAKTKRLMRICYWSPQDREPQPDYRARLTRVMQHIQAFYLREMTAWGFASRSIQLDLENDGLLHLHMVKGTLKSDECSEADGKDGRDIRKDCLKALSEVGIDGEKETLVIFCNLADWDAEKRTMSHHSPYYASGNSQGGTAWQVDSSLLDSALLPVRDQHLQDRQYGRISLGKYNSIFVGGVCHELGHALGLPHCKECAPARRLRGTALMGSGNRTYGNELRGEDKGSSRMP